MSIITSGEKEKVTLELKPCGAPKSETSDKPLKLKIHVDEDIHEIKNLIRNELQVPNDKEIILFDNNQYLQDDQKLDFSKELDTIYYAICNKNEMNSLFPVIIKSFEIYPLMITRETTLEELKCKILGYPDTDQMVRILYNGRQLEGEKTLSDCGVVPFGIIFWTARLRG